MFFGALLALAIHFLPSSKKEIQAEKQLEIASDSVNSENSESNNGESDNKDNPASNKNTDSADKTEQKEVKETQAAQKSSFEIKQKLVSWGYSKSSSRTIDTIIIHSSYNALDNDTYSVNKLINEYKSYGVSPHYLIARDGNVYQLVSDKNIAYHAGESKMPDGRTNVNNFSLGIEIMTTESDSPTDAQYASLINLIKYIKSKYKIKNILGHNQIATGRKTDPWNFNWSKISSVN